jgi:hypothetical protein
MSLLQNSQYVTDNGLVDYRRLKSNRLPLDNFCLSVSSLDPAIYDAWTDKEKIALQISVYNALTLKIVSDQYPIKASFFKSPVYP